MQMEVVLVCPTGAHPDGAIHSQCRAETCLSVVAGGFIQYLRVSALSIVRSIVEICVHIVVWA